jgi:hypothetical protein
MASSGAAPRAAVPVSNARAEASRRNGAKSRGPQSPEGKARSAQNALKHGLRARKYVVLPDEDAAEFAALEAALTEELAPVGALQSILVARIARAAWRLERAERLEVELFAERLLAVPDGNPGLALIRDGNGTRSFETLLRYRGAALAELMRALRLLDALQAGKAVRSPARASVRVAAVRPASVARLPDRPATRATRPNEPDGHSGGPGRRSDGAEAGAAPGARAGAASPPRPLRIPEPAAHGQPSEPETRGQPSEFAHREAPTAPFTTS